LIFQETRNKKLYSSRYSEQLVDEKAGEFSKKAMDESIDVEIDAGLPS
jgi:hypothetical protein